MTETEAQGNTAAARRYKARKRQAAVDALLAANPGVEWRETAERDYFVSDDGRVRRRQYMMRATPDDHGYPTVHLRNRQVRVHRLVAEAFLGPQPPDSEVRHLNDVKTDNRVANLAFGTRSENMLDRGRNGIDPRLNSSTCRNGHPYTPENTRTAVNHGRRHRRCRTCTAAAQARYAERKQAHE